MKFELAFFAGHGILVRVLSSSFLALNLNELSLLFLLDPCATLCFALHIFRKRCPGGIFMLVGRS
jgi:hypothetical protein